MPGRPALRVVSDADFEAGRRALEHYQWEEARELFAKLVERRDSAEAREGLGTALCWLGEIPAALSSYETAFRLHREAGNRRAAGRLATLLAVEYIGTLGADAVGNGWLGRARRELADLEPCPEQAWLALWEAHIAFLLRNDQAGARRFLATGVELARTLAVSEAEAFAASVEGLLLVAEGRIAAGLESLDLATTATVTGELKDIQAIGQAYCYVMRACEQVLDFERAAEWCERAIEISRRLRIGFFESYCRNHYVAVLTWRGAWDEAERELEALAREMAPIAPTVLPEGTARLGELRRRQGRREEAADLFARSEGHPFSALGRAALALDRGDAESAAELVERYFRGLPPEDRIQRAPGWALQARALAALGRTEAAEEALANLRSVAEAAGTEELLGAVRAAEGAVASAAGELDTARRHFEDAVDLFERTASPFEAGRSRIDLAATLAALGRSLRAEEEARTAAAQLERLGAAGELARAQELLRKVAAAAPSGSEPARPAERSGRRGTAGLTARQVEVLSWVARGLSNREIGERLFLSEFTVKRHVADILTALDLPTRAAAAAWAARQGLLE